MKTHINNQRKYVFVCGLQRSGTSVLARNIAKFDGSTGFGGTGVLEDEGQFLQDVYIDDNRLGGTGWFGFDPRAHLTERSPLLTSTNIARLHASWHAYWDPDKMICIEKTPGNLIKTRFLQAAFPNAHFVVVKRHPVPVSLASQRWKSSAASLHSLFEHWLRCYDTFNQDRSHLNNVYELTYEDYIRDPQNYHREIASFLGTKVPEGVLENISGSHNEKYLKRWLHLLINSPFKAYYRYIAAKYNSRFAKHDYSLTKFLSVEAAVATAWRPSFWGERCCDAADAVAALVRLRTKAPQRTWYLAKQVVKLVLPATVVRKVRHSRDVLMNRANVR